MNKIYNAPLYAPKLVWNKVRKAYAVQVVPAFFTVATPRVIQEGEAQGWCYKKDLTTFLAEGEAFDEEGLPLPVVVEENETTVVAEYAGTRRDPKTRAIFGKTPEAARALGVKWLRAEGDKVIGENGNIIRPLPTNKRGGYKIFWFVL